MYLLLSMADVQRQVISRPSSVLKMTGSFRGEPPASTAPKSAGVPLDTPMATKATLKLDAVPVAQLQPSRRKTPGIEAQRVLGVLELLIKKVELLAAVSSGVVQLATLPSNLANLFSEYTKLQDAYRVALDAQDEACAATCCEQLSACARSLFRSGTADGVPAIHVPEVCIAQLQQPLHERSLLFHVSCSRNTFLRTLQAYCNACGPSARSRETS